MGDVVHLADYRRDETAELADLIDQPAAMGALMTGLAVMAPGWPTVDSSAGGDFKLKLMDSLAALGPMKVVEGYALGRFHDMAQQACIDPMDAGELDQWMRILFSPLLRDPFDEALPRLEVGALQDALNELGSRHIAHWQDIAVDEKLGLETAEAFAHVLAVTGPRALTEALGAHLGFL